MTQTLGFLRLRSLGGLVAITLVAGCGMLEVPAETSVTAPPPANSPGPSSTQTAAVSPSATTPSPPAATPPTVTVQPLPSPSQSPGSSPSAIPPAAGTGVPPWPSPAVASASGTSVVTVARGDTVYALSRRHDVPVQTIIAANGLQPPYMLKAGQSIRLPAKRTGQDHVVVKGETLFSIAQTYSVDVQALASVNGLVAPYSISTGQRLTLPPRGATPAAAITARTPPSSGTPSATPAPPPQPTAPTPAITAAEPAAASAPLASPPPRTSSRFAWPVKGAVVSGFGPKQGGRHNDGINIQAPRGTPVLASENGVVAYAGNELRGFGNLVLLRHSDGWVTAYAHADRLAVQRGDTVRRGQVIAYVGSTGSVAEAQLHFQIRQGKQAVDPRKHLTPSA